MIAQPLEILTEGNVKKCGVFCWMDAEMETGQFAKRGENVAVSHKKENPLGEHWMQKVRSHRSIEKINRNRKLKLGITTRRHPSSIQQ